MLNKLLSKFKTKQPQRKVVKKPVGLVNSISDLTTYKKPLVSSSGGFRVSVEGEMNKKDVTWFTKDVSEEMFDKLKEKEFNFTTSIYKAFQSKPEVVYYKQSDTRTLVKDWLEVEVIDGEFYNVATR